ncbi:MAG: MmgE/PrpD family protein [Phycisphaerales bacterium]|nr:MmgE/PrpD family protein [Phycisphaerales bacterium]
MSITLPRSSNQALGLAQFAIDFMGDDPLKKGAPDATVLARTNLFHTDACLCGLSALALGTNAPRILREEALDYPDPAGATVFGSTTRVKAEKAILANAAAVREWDSNGTNFGFRPEHGHTAGEFGHNDFYPVAIAAAQVAGLDGEKALRAMVLHDEIRGRLAEVFSLKTYKIDHVVHGAIASAAVYGAMTGATADQIEAAIGMTVAHYIPFRAIRAGKQLSDSKGSSAAISTEAAIMSVHRAKRGFLGPRDIFRNPEAIFRIFEGPGQMFQKVGATSANTGQKDESPFDLVLSRDGTDFTVMGMHFKLGLYEHQSAGALQAMITLLGNNQGLLNGDIARIKIVAYEPAFGIIGDPAKRKPTTRQSADHSMVYIVATLLRKALEKKAVSWTDLMLEPADYADDAIANPETTRLMDLIEFEHGGAEYDRRYPDGIPTSVVITDGSGRTYDSGLVMYPGGHARNAMGETPVDLEAILHHKFRLLGGLAFADPEPIIARLSDIGAKSASDIATINDFALTVGEGF